MSNKVKLSGTPKFKDEWMGSIWQKEQIQSKLTKLIELIESQVIYKSMDLVTVKKIEQEYYFTKKISGSDMRFCNEIWRKYNK